MAQEYFSGFKRKFNSPLKGALLGVIKTISADIRQSMKGEKILEDLLIHSKELTSRDLMTPQKPEVFTIEKMVKPFIQALEYEKNDIIGETYQEVDEKTKWADFTLNVKDKKILLEVEPLNKDLEKIGSGIDQIRTLILQKPIETDYGVVTDGFKWILMKYDRNAHKSKILARVDLRPLFLMNILNQKVLESDVDALLKEFFESFSRDNILLTLEEKFFELETQREKISQSFYSEYMKFVFGTPLQPGGKRGYCLLNAIRSPEGSTPEDIGLFAVNFMNKLFFVKFIEDIDVIPRNLLKEMWEKFEKSRDGILGTFYKSNLEPLFFGVFSKPITERDQNIQRKPFFNKIPYLNGGLFRTVVGNEKEFDIEDDIVDVIITDFIEKYSFTVSGEKGLDPDILGNVFEKTINYISKPGTDAQKAKGAYYTPDDVVTYITKKTLYPYLLNKIKEAYTQSGWTASDLRGYTSLEAFLSSLPRTTGDIREALTIVDTVRVLDPACGSGHFLTSALKELFYIKRRLLDEIKEEYDPYQLKMEIIRRNLFGVDIEAPAIEIAKLRLWLSLMEDIEVEKAEHLGTLPNIEYNILQGNSLIGWVDESMEQEMLIKPYNAEVQHLLEELEHLYADEAAQLLILREVKENLKTSDTDRILRAYVSLKDIYRLETSERAEKLKALIDKLQENIYAYVTRRYAAYLSRKKLEVPSDLEDVFHWRIDFYEVMKEDGFDIVIGNPPYVEVPERGRIPFKGYYTGECGNTHAYFYERSLRLVREGGFCGFIVPLSSISTDRMGDLQELLVGESARLWISNYDDRPGRLFSGLEHCRSSIVVSQKKKGEECTQVFTTKYNRWNSENRDSLFENISYVEATDFVLEGSIPKIGTEIEKSILRKISRNKKLMNYTKKEGNGEIWYHNSPQYWIRALDFIPFFWNEREGSKISSQLVGLHVHPVEYRKVVAAVLNSSLFYWFFTLYSDGRHLVAREIENFPLSADEIPEDIRGRIEARFDDLMEDYRRNAVRKVCQYRTTGRVEYDEFRPGLSKPIIDDIDNILSEYYGFTDEERAFIVNFDKEFRLKEVY